MTTREVYEACKAIDDLKQTSNYLGDLYRAGQIERKKIDGGKFVYWMPDERAHAPALPATPPEETPGATEGATIIPHRRPIAPQEQTAAKPQLTDPWDAIASTLPPGVVLSVIKDQRGELGITIDTSAGETYRLGASVADLMRCLDALAVLRPFCAANGWR